MSEQRLSPSTSPTFGVSTPPSDTGGSNSPPRPRIPSGHGGPIRKPHPHDVLSGRGGRINSHPGNVRFREIVDSHKREYLDPRTKKVEKARIAARIVASIRSSDPPGRFLKEDADVSAWVEIGDEKAWKKTGQALRESAPEIRAEKQAQLQMLAAAANRADLLEAVGGERKARQADPPARRHRPNPPDREGLTANRGDEYYEDPRAGYGQQQSWQPQQYQQPQQFEVEDEELKRMREDYERMQRMQEEQARRMREYQDYLMQRKQQQQQQQQMQNFGRDVHEGYHQMERQVQQSGHIDQYQMGNYQDRQIAAIGNEDNDASFPVPAPRGDHFNYSVGNSNSSAVLAQEAFDRQFNSCDKTVSTMSSFDVHSMDMSSMGGFSFSQSGYNMSGLMSTGSAQRTTATYGSSFNGSSRSNTRAGRGGGGLTALERKLEKANEAHRAQKAQVEQLQVPTQKESQQQRSNDSNNNSRKYDVSLNSFGFEAIDEDGDDASETSYKASNLGLSEMDMTFTSDIMSVKSKSLPNRRATAEDKSDDDTFDRKASMESKSSAEGGEPASKDQSDESAQKHVVQSLSSNSNASISVSTIAKKNGASSFSLDEFNESFKSMEMEDRSRVSSSKQKQRKDPDGVVGGQQTSTSMATRPIRRKDPNATRLPTISSSHRNHGSNGGAPSAETRRQSVESLGLSDPDLLASYKNRHDLGASLESFRSGNSEGSLWVNQYNSMENVSDDRNPWDDEDRGNGSSDGNMSMASEISAPRMVAATGGEGM